MNLQSESEVFTASVLSGNGLQEDWCIKLFAWVEQIIVETWVSCLQSRLGQQFANSVSPLPRLPGELFMANISLIVCLLKLQSDLNCICLSVSVCLGAGNKRRSRGAVRHRLPRREIWFFKINEGPFCPDLAGWWERDEKWRRTEQIAACFLRRAGEAWVTTGRDCELCKDTTGGQQEIHQKIEKDNLKEWAGLDEVETEKNSSL